MTDATEPPEVGSSSPGCGHTGAAVATACSHLTGPHDSGVKYARWLTGNALEVELVCAECLALRESGDAIIVTTICEACSESLEDENGQLLGTRGRAGIRQHLEPFDSSLAELPLPSGFEVIDFGPIPRTEGAWLLLCADGRLTRFDSRHENWQEVGHVAIQEEKADNGWDGHVLAPRLHISGNGRFVAVVNDHGQLGAIYDIPAGRQTMELNGGDYHPETVPFSFAFVEHDGKTVAIHRTAWNRLDASDASTGELLTERGPTSYSTGEPTPEHYLDYFHGRLLVSPDGRHVVDDGWVWHPVGIPEVWDIRLWLTSNVWESEDGPSKFWLAHRTYYWDHAMCWIGSDRIAVGGIGDDDDKIFAGARIFSASEVRSFSPGRSPAAEELIAFAGPGDRFFSDGSRLFAVDDRGLSIWDVDAGAMIGTIDGFNPTRQHTESRELVELEGRTLRIWRYGS